MKAGKLDMGQRWQFHPYGGGAGWYVQFGSVGLALYRSAGTDIFRHRYIMRLHVGMFQAMLTLVDCRGLEN